MHIIVTSGTYSTDLHGISQAQANRLITSLSETERTEGVRISVYPESQQERREATGRDVRRSS